MWHKLLVPLLLFVVLSIRPTVYAVPVPTLNLAALTRAADLIVVGKVTAIREAGTKIIDVSGHSMSTHIKLATLQVERKVKGEVRQQNIDFEFLVPSLPLGYKAVSSAQFGMFFLRAAAPSRYVVLNPYFPFVHVSKQAPAIQGSELEKVVAEVAHILVAGNASAKEREQAIEILSRVESPNVLEELRRAFKTLDPPLRLMVGGVLLSRNDISVLHTVERALLHPPPNISKDILRGLAGALNDVRDPRAVPSLFRLLSASDVYTRRGAIKGLRLTASRDALKPLSAGLTDYDFEVRYNAVIGLAEITNQYEWGPSVALFQKDENHYLNYWLSWAKAR